MCSWNPKMFTMLYFVEKTFKPFSTFYKPTASTSAFNCFNHRNWMIFCYVEDNRETSNLFSVFQTPFHFAWHLKLIFFSFYKDIKGLPQNVYKFVNNIDQLIELLLLNLWFLLSC